MDGHLVMSFKERQRLKVLERVVRSESTLVEASRQLGLSYRQTIRIRDRYVSEGDAGLVHRLRGRRSGRALDERLKSQAVSLYVERYEGFGPTLASEMLSEREGIVVHPETLRRWLVEADRWEVRKARVHHRKQREPRKCFGELVQMDGSFHDWFEGRAPKCFLMSMVDDATGRTLLSFAPQETTWAALELLERWVRLYGIPGSLYVDRKTVYLTGRASTLEEDLEDTGALTQFGRACHKLGIGLIPAYSPQAKGRVERKHGVCQDRLVKEMRLNGICDIEAANAFLDSWVPKLNNKFSRVPASPHDAHRPLPPDTRLRSIFCIEHVRTVASDWTIRFCNRILQIERQPGLPRAGKRIHLQQDKDGSILLVFEGRQLIFRELDARPVTAATQHKTQKPRTPAKPAPDHPWRYRQEQPKQQAPIPRDVYKPTPQMVKELAETYLGDDPVRILERNLGHF